MKIKLLKQRDFESIRKEWQPYECALPGGGHCDKSIKKYIIQLRKAGWATTFSCSNTIKEHGRQYANISLAYVCFSPKSSNQAIQDIFFLHWLLETTRAENKNRWQVEAGYIKCLGLTGDNFGKPTISCHMFLPKNTKNREKTTLSQWQLLAKLITKHKGIQLTNETRKKDGQSENR